MIDNLSKGGKTFNFCFCRLSVSRFMILVKLLRLLTKKYFYYIIQNTSSVQKKGGLGVGLLNKGKI